MVGTDSVTFLCTATLLLLAAVGCGGSDVPDLYKLKGTVTHAGQPVTGVTVVFLPANGKRPSYGSVDKDGHFIMSNTSNGDGVQVGENTISLMPASPNPDDPEPSEEMAALLEKYSEAKSTLKVTIDSDQENYELKLE